MDARTQAQLYTLGGIFGASAKVLRPWRPGTTFAEFQRLCEAESLRMARQDIATLLAWKVLTS